MNSKKAKALRKVLKNLGKLNPQLETSTAYVEDVNKRKTITVQDMDETGTLVDKVVPISSGTVMLSHKSVRSLYKHLKSGLKANQVTQEEIKEA